MFASKKIIALVNKIKTPFNINGIAQEVGAVALLDFKHWLLSKGLNMF